MNKRWNREEILANFGDSNNELVQIALKFNSTKITDPECSHYCDFYAQHFEPLKDANLRILEIGVKEGDSLIIWKEYFKNRLIFGLEKNAEPLHGFVHEKIKVFIGDQTNIETLKNITREAGPFDIIIDDASHVMSHHQISFNYLFRNSLADNGMYVIEDLGTSYWHDWEGGLHKATSTIEFLKNLIDGVNYRFHKGGRTQYVGIPEPTLTPSTYFDENIVGLSFYKGMCFVQKGRNAKE